MYVIWAFSLQINWTFPNQKCTYCSIAKFAGGVIVPVKKHDAIPLEDIMTLAEFMNGECKVPFVNALSILHRKLFPFFCNPHPWVAGKPLNIYCLF